MTPAPACAECKVLKSRYRTVLWELIEAASKLKNSQDFQGDYAEAEKVRLVWQQSRAALTAI